jgi:hypothetical protein
MSNLVYEQQPVQIGTNSMFGIGVQAQYGKLQGRNANYTWYSTTAIPHGPNQPVANLPLEMGRNITPRGAYKTGIFNSGPVPIIPRLDRGLGTLLLCALGQDTLLSNYKFGDLHDVSQVGSYIHGFGFNTNEADLPYFSIRRYLQHLTQASAQAEQAQDCHINTLEITMPSVGPLTTNCDIIGRIPETMQMFKADAYNNWDLAAASYGSDDAFALGVHFQSTVKIEIGGQPVELPVTGAVVSLINNLLSPDQARVVGAQTPLDYPALSRQCTFRLTCLLTDYDLYSYIFSNLPHTTARNFSPTVLKSDISMVAYSPVTFEAAASDIYYGLEVRTLDNNIAWGLQGPMQPTAGQPLVLNLIGTAQRQTGNNAYVEFRLQNAESIAYTEPVDSGHQLGITLLVETPPVDEHIGAYQVDAFDGTLIDNMPHIFDAGAIARIKTGPDAVAFAATKMRGKGNIPNGTYTYMVVFDSTDAKPDVKSGTVVISDNNTDGQSAIENIPVGTDDVLAKYLYRARTAGVSPATGLATGGALAGAPTSELIVTVKVVGIGTGAGGVDQFVWRNRDSQWEDAEDIPVGAYTLNATGGSGDPTNIEADGLTITFAATTGHTLNQEWIVSAQDGADVDWALVAVIDLDVTTYVDNTQYAGLILSLTSDTACAPDATTKAPIMVATGHNTGGTLVAATYYVGVAFNTPTGVILTLRGESNPVTVAGVGVNRVSVVGIPAGYDAVDPSLVTSRQLAIHESVGSSWRIANDALGNPINITDNEVTEATIYSYGAAVTDTETISETWFYVMANDVDMKLDFD